MLAESTTAIALASIALVGLCIRKIIAVDSTCLEKPLFQISFKHPDEERLEHQEDAQDEEDEDAPRLERLEEVIPM